MYSQYLVKIARHVQLHQPEELFDETGKLFPELRELAPQGDRRMSANPIANGGTVRKPLRIPDFQDYAVTVTHPGAIEVANTKPLGVFLRDIMKMNMSNFRVFGPDKNTSNKLTAIYEVSKKLWLAESFPEDQDDVNVIVCDKQLHLQYLDIDAANSPCTKGLGIWEWASSDRSGEHLHVHGYQEKGNINTPLELAINNQVDRFSIAIDVIDRVPMLQVAGAHAKEAFRNQQIDCINYAHEEGIDMPEILNWKWTKS